MNPNTSNRSTRFGALTLAGTFFLATLLTASDQETSAESSPENRYEGILVSLADYLKREDQRENLQIDPETQDRLETLSERLDPKGSAAEAAKETPLLGLLVREQSSGDADESGRGSGEGVGERSQLCLLLFKPEKAYLKVKACELCEPLADGKTDGTKSSRDSADPETASPPTVTITGKRVTRGGLSAIFVEDIRS